MSQSGHRSFPRSHHYQCLFPHPEILTSGTASSTNGSPHHPMRSNSIPNIRDPSTEKPVRATGRSPPPHRRHNSIRGSSNDTCMSFAPCKLFHEELLLQWVVSSGCARELALTNSSFFFDLVIKSASENMKLSGASDLPRKERFTHQFLTTL